MKKISEYISTAEGVQQMWDDINEILDNFDFSAIKVAMDALEWEWACKDDEADDLIETGHVVHCGNAGMMYKPEVTDIMKTARKRLIDVINSAVEYEKETGVPSERYTASSGGFEARVEIIPDETRKEIYGDDAPDDFKHSVDLTIKFIIEENLSKMA